MEIKTKTADHRGLVLAALTLAVFFLTTNPIIKPVAIYVLIASIISAILVWYLKIKKRVVDPENPEPIPWDTYLLIFSLIMIAILIWIGLSGWYFSPFFYFLYLLALAIGFLFSVASSFVFALVLIGIFLPNLGRLDILFDALTLLSLLLVLPLTYFLRREYLRLRENDKKILILESENKKYRSKVEEILSNKIIKVAADLREPLNDIKQMAQYLAKNLTKKQTEVYTERIVASSQRGIEILEGFEEKATGTELVKTPATLDR